MRVSVGADLLVIWGRPMFYGKKRAYAPEDPTGVRVQAPGERLAEITSGRANSQQGLATTCKDPLYTLKAVGGFWSDA